MYAPSKVRCAARISTNLGRRKKEVSKELYFVEHYNDAGDKIWRGNDLLLCRKYNRTRSVEAEVISVLWMRL